MRSLSTCQDHKPDSPGERERLEAAGSEVRQVGAQVCLYQDPCKILAKVNGKINGKMRW